MILGRAASEFLTSDATRNQFRADVLSGFIKSEEKYIASIRKTTEEILAGINEAKMWDYVSKRNNYCLSKVARKKILLNCLEVLSFNLELIFIWRTSNAEKAGIGCWSAPRSFSNSSLDTLFLRRMEELLDFECFHFRITAFLRIDNIKDLSLKTASWEGHTSLKVYDSIQGLGKGRPCSVSNVKHIELNISKQR